MSTTIAAPPTGFAPPAMPPRMTPEEFARRHAGDRVEYIGGRVVEMEMPFPKHGKVCTRITSMLDVFAQENDCGHVVSNDSWVQLPTPDDPSLVLGPDVFYVSYDRMPRGDLPDGPLPTIPELVVEVKSPSDRKKASKEKVDLYLLAGVPVVLTADPESKTMVVHTSVGEGRLTKTDTLELPDILPGFRVPVAKFFA
jgi:Uma2 family endonuclease